MANVIHITKTHLIMGPSLPVAVLLGYLLAERMELDRMAVVFAIVAGLCAAFCSLPFRGISAAVSGRGTRRDNCGGGIS